MRTVFIFLVASLFLLGGLAEQAEAEVKFGFSIGGKSLKEFEFAIQDHYRVTEVEFQAIKSYIPTEEIPVALFIARKGRVAPTVIVDLRRTGMRWIDIMRQLRVSPEAIYVPVTQDIKELQRPPYGKAYGHYKDKPRKEWKNIILRDTEVIDLVNLKFMVKYHRRRPEEIIKLRSGKRSFITINTDIEKRKQEEVIEKQKEREQKRKARGKEEKRRKKRERKIRRREAE